MSETQREAAAGRLWGGQVPEPDDNPWLEVFFAGWDARSAALPSREQIAEAMVVELKAQEVYVDGELGEVLIDASGGDYADLLRVADAVLSLLSGGSGE